MAMVKPHLYYTIEAKLLEDLHSGNGMGSPGGLDAIQGRNRFGFPRLRSTHFKGILKENAKILNLAMNNGINDAISRLFGEGGYNNKGELQLTSLTAISNKKQDLVPPNAKIWVSTSREEYSRIPKYDTLRMVEYVPAGTVFSGKALVPVTQKKLFEKLLKCSTNLGSSRTRGAGQIQFTKIKPVKEDWKNVPDIKGNGNTLRLLLKNEEPLIIASNRYSGNLLKTDNFIRGISLKSAFADWWTARYQDPKSFPLCLSDNIMFSDSLFCFNSQDFLHRYKNDPVWITKTQVIPIPLSLNTIKHNTESLEKPWWSEDTITISPLVDKSRELTSMEKEMGKLKRPKANEVLICFPDTEKWEKTTPILNSNLRNSTPNRYIRDTDWFDDSRTNEGELFTEEEIAENQYFIGDISFGSESQAKQFIEQYCPLFNATSWIRIGRGGRAVSIIDVTLHNKPINDPFKEEEIKSLKILLTSDLIARTNDLNFATVLTPTILKYLLQKETNSNPFNEKEVYLRKDYSIYETVEIRGWNYLTGTTRSPAIAIKRGSVFTYEGDDVRSLKKALLNHPIIGERKNEGFGHIMIYPDFNFQKKSHLPTKSTYNENINESLIAKAQALFDDYGADFIKTLQKTQLLGIIELLKIESIQWNDILQKLDNHSKKKAGKDWEEPLKTLQRISKGLIGDQQKTIMLYFFKELVLSKED